MSFSECLLKVPLSLSTLLKRKTDNAKKFIVNFQLFKQRSGGIYPTFRLNS